MKAGVNAGAREGGLDLELGAVIWFTGLSGSGKSTLSRLIAPELKRHGFKCEVLDGDVVRTNLCKGLGFSKEDRDTNIRRIGFVARLLARNGVCAITAAISPYRAVRNEVREQVEAEGVSFVEVYAKCSLEAAEARDAKGLYKKARKGEIKAFTGISDPYEAPIVCEVTVETDKEKPEESAARILQHLGLKATGS